MNILSNIIKLSLAVASLMLCSVMQAQKQPLSPELIFKLRQANHPAEIVKWIDNKSFLVGKRGDKTAYFTVTVKGKTTVETEIDEDEYQQYFPPDRLEMDGGKIFYDDELIVDGNNSNPELSPDGQYVAYTRNNDLYVTRLLDKKEFRLTSDGSQDVMNGYASWVYMEEILGRHTHYRAFWWSPDSKNIAFFRTDDSRVPLFSITDSPDQHGRLETIRYPKAGDPNPEVKIGIIDSEGSRPTVWADFDPKQDQYFGKPCWTPSGKSLWVQWTNRDQNTLKIFDVDTGSGSAKEIYVEVQNTWIDIDRDNTVNFLSDGKAIILSDRSKHTHLYLHDTSGNLLNPITQGEFSVLDIVKIDEKNKTVYFTCFKDNIACRDFYKVSFDGKQMQRLSFGDYTHDVRLSPDAAYFVSTFSNVNTPVKSSLCSTSGKLVVQLYDSRNEENEKYEWAKTELVTVASDDGRYQLPIRISYPPNFDKSKKYPVLISVYGGPGAVTVNQGWTGNSQMQHLYASEGLIQVAMDHRGSRHFGKRGQDEMYRNLGKVEIRDYSTCVRWLIANAQADPERICINGFSYGGYITCYALLTAPELFTHGIAGGSVTDWMLYDAPYTERFMAHPKNNPEGYRQSSTLVHASKLKGKLLLTHGLIDENVHVQNTFQLVDAFEENNKYFDLVIYPSARHGYGGAKGTHFRNLQIKFIYEHLLKKPLPAVLNPL